MYRFLLFGLLLLLAACSGNNTPAAPVGLTATADAGQVVLNWQDSSGGTLGFSVYRQQVLEGTSLENQQSRNFKKLAQVDAGVTTYTDTLVAPGTFYRYQVTTRGERRESAPTALTQDTPVEVKNQAPTAEEQTLSITEDTPLTVTLSGSDPEGDALSYRVITQPQHGTLSGDAPALTYTPNENYSGSDSFSFTVSDGNSASAPATVTIDIMATDLEEADVTNILDDVNTEGSLRYALGNASAGDTVVVAKGLKDQTITLASTLTLEKDVAIEGNGVIVSGDDQVRVLKVKDSVKVELKDLILTKGGVEEVIDYECYMTYSAFPGNGICNLGELTLSGTSTVTKSVSDVGGGIYSTGTLILQDDASIRNNTASGFVYGGGGVYSTGTLILKDSSRVSGNQVTTQHDGGGVYNDGGTLVLQNDANISGNSASSGGGVYSNRGTLTLEDDSSISDNVADTGGGVYSYRSTSTVQDSASISGNTASSNGGGVFLYEVSTLILEENASISDNVADTSGGGVFNGFSSVLTLKGSSSITGNRADSDGDNAGMGGGVFNDIQATLNNNGNIVNNIRGSTSNEVPDNVSP